jgi:hypothetical protein
VQNVFNIREHFSFGARCEKIREKERREPQDANQSRGDESKINERSGSGH